MLGPNFCAVGDRGGEAKAWHGSSCAWLPHDWYSNALKSTSISRPGLLGRSM